MKNNILIKAMLKMAYTVVFCSLISLAGIAAQELVDEGAAYYDGEEDKNITVTITGTKTEKRLQDSPVVTEVISGEEIENSQAQSVIDVLADYGLVFRGNGTSDYVQMQGMDKARVLYLVDGRRVIGRNSQRINGESLPIGSIERIEIIRGAQSTLYGSEAMGGVINIITKKSDKKSYLSAAISNKFLFAYNDPEDNSKRKAFDDFNPFREQNIKAEAGFSISKLLNITHGEFARADSYNDKDGVSILPKYYSLSEGFKTFLPVNEKIELNWGGAFMQMRRDSTTNINEDIERIDYLRTDAFIELNYTPSSSLHIDAQFYDNYYERDRDAFSAANKTWVLGNNHETENIAAFEATGSYSGIQNFIFDAGLEAYYNTMRKASLKEKSVSRDSEALFGQAEYYKSDRYSIIGGIRLERDSQFGFIAVPKLSAMYHLPAGFRILGGGGLGYRAPSFNDLYQNFSNTTQWVRGNPNLKPEYSISSNAALEWSYRKNFVQVNVYYTELFDEIDTVLTETKGRQRIYDYRNISRSYRFGLDAETKVYIIEYFYFGAGYNWLSAYDRSSKEELHLQPEHTLRFKSGIEHKRIGINAYFQGRYFSKFPMLLGGQDIVKAPRFILDFYASQNIGGNFSVNLGVENITGTIDTTLGPFTAQAISLGVKYHY
jgi:outer membrane receptor for ferrienterochelin and colicins